MENKRSKLLVKLTAVIMLVAIISMFLVACAKDEEPEPAPTPKPDETVKVTIDDVKMSIEEAFYKSFDFDTTKPLGFEYSLFIPTDNITINVKGYLDTKNTAESRMYLDAVKGKDSIFALAADDEYLYFTSPSEKRRIRGFEMANVLDGALLPNGEAIEDSMVSMLVSVVLDMVYTSDEFEQVAVEDGTKNVINGDFGDIADILGSLLEGIDPAIGEAISGLLGDIKTKMTIIIDKAGEISDVDLAFTKGESNTKVSFTSKLDNYNPEIMTPSKTDATYIESNVLNFKLVGAVDMTAAGNYAETIMTTYKYEIYVDLDVFGMLQNAIEKDENGTITFDATKLFDIEDGAIYFNLSHNCTGDDGCNKVEQANGSILTLAFAPRDFGTNDFFISLRPLAILPNGFFEAMGLPSMIEGMLGGTFGTNISPAALFASMGAGATASAYAEPVSMDINPLAIIGSVLDVLSDIRLNEADGLRIGVDSVTDLLHELAPVMNTGDINVAALVKSFFGEANYMNIRVNNSAYGDPALENYDYLRMFMTIDENVGEYKFNASRPGPAVSFEPVLDTNGNLAIFSDKVTTVEEIKGDNGTTYKSLPLSRAEFELMLTGQMSIKYKYETITGTTGEAGVFVNDIIGLDLDNIGKEQDVRVITSIADGSTDGSVGSLISLLIGLLKMDISIPGQVIDTKLTVAAEPTIELSQPDSLGATKFDASKAYKYDDPLYGNFDIKLTYGDEVKMLKDVAPVDGLQNLASNSNKTKSKVQAVKDFVLDFGIYGKVNVKVDSSNYTKPSDESVKITAGETYRFPKTTNYMIDDAKKSITANANNATFTVPEGVEVETLMRNGIFGPVFDAYAVTFNKAGKYSITMNFNTGVSKVYNFEVSEALPVLPEFTAAIKGSKGKFNITLGRTNQIQDIDSVIAGIRVTGTSVVGADSEEEPIVQELVFGTDYKVIIDGMELKDNKFTLEAFQGIPTKMTIEITNATFASNSIKVEFFATEYGNANIGGGERA